MSKPWNKLRESLDGDICGGEWFAHCHGTHNASVNVSFEDESTVCLIIDDYHFDPIGLRELAAFCLEVADQLESP